MKITINTEVLRKEHLSLNEFLVLLLGFFNVNYDNIYDKLIEEDIISSDCYGHAVILSNNTKDRISRILASSDEKVINSNLDYISLAQKLQTIYPEGNKQGTTYPWKDSLQNIVYKLQALTAFHNFTFTEEEAINATKQYVTSFSNLSYMQLLRNFILKTIVDEDGNKEITSQFMTIIENNRNENNN